VIVAVDLGTTVTKGALCRASEIGATARRAVPTHHPAPGRDEQDPEDWWQAFTGVLSDLARAEPASWRRVETVVFSAARETFALFDTRLRPLGPGILWSDRRGEPQALGADPAEFLARTGVVLGPATAAAKLAVAAASAPGARWALTPRDWIVARLTGSVVTDHTLASRTGCHATDGTPTVDAALAAFLPDPVPSVTALPVDARHADEVGLPPGVTVIVGAGDRACEVLGTGAGPEVPMVSWGTTANVSVPVPRRAALDLPASRAAHGGWIVEMGLSAAGSALAWLAGLGGQDVSDLWAAAGRCPPGANGVLALPWFAGARAPWWRPDHHAVVAGLTPAHDLGTLARAVIEGVAFDVARSLARAAPGAEALVLAGSGSRQAIWPRVLAAATGRTVRVRHHPDATLVGAWILALGDRDVGRRNPVVAEVAPDPAEAAALADARVASDQLAAAVLGSGR
jgi:xylulokinase